MNRLADGADRLGKALDRMLRRHVAGLEMHLGGAVIIAGDEAVEDFRQEPPLLRPKPAHDAEIDGDEARLVVDEQISGVHVGMKEAVAQRVAQKCLDHRTAEFRQVEISGFEPRAVGQRRRVDPFQRQHILGGAVPIDRRHAEVGIGLGVLRHFRERGGLETEIHFERHRAAQCLDDLDKPQAARLGGKTFRIARHKCEGVEIGAKAPLDSGPHDFHRNRAPALRGRDLATMHLRNRGGGDSGTEARKHLAQRLAERRRDRRLGFGLRKRRHLVLQAFEIARERDADDIGPGRQELAELDVARAKPGERSRKPRIGSAACRALDETRNAKCRPRGKRQRRRIDQAEHAFAGKHEAGAAETQQMCGAGDHKRQPECNATMPPVIGRNVTREKCASRIMAANACGFGKRRIDSTR